MNLKQLECPLQENLAAELSSIIEDSVLSVSWFEKDPETWVFQTVYESSRERPLQEKIKGFFQKKKLDLPPIVIGLLPQKDWVSAVHRHFPPLTLGCFYIFGSHIEESPPAGLISLKIDAATAFGSGQHESTEGCLKVLSLLAGERSFISPLDMGCGSGILALAMASLWKVQVLACDNDEEAVRVTQQNARVNRLDHLVKTQVSEGFTSLKNKTFDIIAANILAGPLCQMAGEAVRALLPEGHIILSGLLNRQAENVIDTYRSVGMRLVNQLFIGDWSTLLMRKKSDG